MKDRSKLHKLPIVFRSMDIDDMTKSVGIVQCPRRDEPITVASCGVCKHFRCISFATDHRTASVTCRTPSRRAEIDERASSKPRVKEVLHLPLLCASFDTPLEDLLPFVTMQQPWDVIPVLGWSAEPLGLVSNERLRTLLKDNSARGRVVGDVMNTQFARVTADMTLREAAEHVPNDGFRGAVVIGSQGTLLGLVSEFDLML